MMKNVLIFIISVASIPHILAGKDIPRFEIDRIISENKIVSLTNQKFLIIDVWATWCKPCVPATRQLEIIQKARSNDIYVVSVSDENTGIIRKYLEKTPISLAVMKDNSENGVIHALDIQTRPYAVMLNADGEIIYQGHPSEINSKLIDNFLRKYRTDKKMSLENIFTIASNSGLPGEKAGDGIKIQRNDNISEKNIYIERGDFYFRGRILDFLKYILNVSSFQINLKNIENYGLNISCPVREIETAKQNPFNFVRQNFNWDVRVSERKTECNLLKITNENKLWDDKQIDLGEDGIIYPYLIGADRIEADNLTVPEMASLLSDVKKKVFWYNGNNNKRYDWNFHYLYDNLMEEDLKYNFGITVTKNIESIPVYVISDKNENTR